MRTGDEVDSFGCAAGLKPADCMCNPEPVTSVTTWADDQKSAACSADLEQAACTAGFEEPTVVNPIVAYKQ